MLSINKVFIVGTLTNTPIINTTKTGIVIAKIKVITQQDLMKRSTKRTSTSLNEHDITLFGEVAELVEGNLGKGTLVYVEGRLKTNRWLTKEGIQRTSTEIIGEVFKILDNKRKEEKRLNSSEDSGDEMSELDRIKF
jgi:single-strand DNA-binding protein